MDEVTVGAGAAFDDVYYASYTSVLRAVILLVLTQEDAHDVVQEAYARALARWDDVGRLDSPEAWVRKVAVNAAIDTRRRERSRRTAYRRFLGRPLPVPASGADGVDVERALAALPPAQRQAIVLHYLVDMSVAQIAAETGRPVGTVKTNLARGRTALAGLLRVPVEESLDA
jgi:RNA polymerase sigma-70 factor (ECF subfamily)